MEHILSEEDFGDADQQRQATVNDRGTHNLSSATLKETDVVLERQSIKERILRPYNKLRNIHAPPTLLVLASEGSLNVPQDLATFTEGDPPVSVRYASKLPLVNFDKHPPVDAIALVYKIFNEDSLQTIKKNLPLIDARYFADRCFILAFADAEYDEHDVANIAEISRVYSLPLHYVVKKKATGKDGPNRLQIPHRLMSIYCPPVRCDVSTSTVLAALSNPYV